MLYSVTLLIYFCIICPYLFYKSLSVQGLIPVCVISLVIVKVTHDSTLLLRIFVPKISYNLLYISLIFPILSSSSHSSILPSSISSSSSSSSIFSNLFFFFLSYFFQFLSNRPQYSLSNFLLSHLYSIFAVYLFGNSPFMFSLLFLLSLNFPISLYSSLNSLTKSSMFSRFSLGFQISSFAVYPFHYTKYWSFPLNFFLFNIFSTSYSFSPLIITGAGHSLFWPFTWSLYLHTLLMFTTGCIFIVLGKSSSITFVKRIPFTWSGSTNCSISFSDCFFFIWYLRSFVLKST